MTDGWFEKRWVWEEANHYLVMYLYIIFVTKCTCFHVCTFIFFLGLFCYVTGYAQLPEVGGGQKPKSKASNKEGRSEGKDEGTGLGLLWSRGIRSRGERPEGLPLWAGQTQESGQEFACWLGMEHTKLSSGLSEGSCDASRMAKQSKNVAYRPSENKQTNNNPEMQSRIYACPWHRYPNLLFSEH